MTPELTCPLCASSSVDPEFVAENGYAICRCHGCGLRFTDDRAAPPPEELYPHFDQTEDAGARAARDATSVFLWQRAAVVRSQKRSGRALDYGCGNGAFARHMARRGFESVGIEPFSLGKPSHESGLTLLRGPLVEHASTIGEFDAITMWHVLEHLKNPVEVLSSLRAVLRPNGVIVVSVPNVASWQSKVFKGAWFHLDPPRHVLHFDHKTLADCMDRAGFAIVAHHEFLPEYGSSGWIQSALNQVLPHKNFLYEYVKDRGALRSLSSASRAAHLLASAALGAPLFALSVPAEALASAFPGRSAALTVVARAK